MAKGRGNRGVLNPENSQQLGAYKHYLRLGSKYKPEEIKIIAKEAQVTAETIRNWYRKYDWSSRSLQEVPTEPMDKGQFQGLIAETAKQFKKKLDAGKIVIRYVQDLEKLVKIDALLRGEKTGSETTINLVGVLPRPVPEVKPETKDPFAKKPLDLVDIKKN